MNISELELKIKELQYKQFHILDALSKNQDTELAEELSSLENEEEKLLNQLMNEFDKEDQD